MLTRTASLLVYQATNERSNASAQVHDKIRLMLKFGYTAHRCTVATHSVATEQLTGKCLIIVPSLAAVISSTMLTTLFSTRNVLLFSLILLAAIATNWVIDRGELNSEIPGGGRNDPDMYMLDANITQFSLTGDRRHDIQASRLTHFPLTDMTALITPRIRLFTLHQDQPWKITADNGRLLPRSQLRDQMVELWDNVLATREDQSGQIVLIKTSSLTVIPDQDYAETDQPVVIEDTDGFTSAAGMKAYLGQGRYEFFSSSKDRVLTTLQPHPRKLP
jgi:lipopolysaccharide export system protein LptC